jgi:hypothetical protein
MEERRENVSLEVRFPNQDPENRDGPRPGATSDVERLTRIAISPAQKKKLLKNDERISKIQSCNTRLIPPKETVRNERLRREPPVVSQGQ